MNAFSAIQNNCKTPAHPAASPFFAPTIQPKLTINQPGDVHEQEADQVADQVVQRLATPALPPSVIQAKCANCEQEEKLQKKEEEEQPVQQKIQRKSVFDSNTNEKESDGNHLQRKSNNDGATGASPDFSARLQSSKGGGSPLPKSTQTTMGSAMASDFSGVRIHTGSEAAGMSQSINAQAFTHGNDVYFNEGKYSPDSTEGKRLLAHELVHTVQQGGGNYVQQSIQRACGPASIGTQSGCNPVSQSVSGDRFLFRVNCDTFRPGEERRLRLLADTITNGETIDIHGQASMDGDLTFNENLSCARTHAAEHVINSVLSTKGITATINLFMHGATPGASTMQRSVIVDRIAPPPPLPNCGPDASDWFIRQVSTAMSDTDILDIQRDMIAADAIARRYGTTVNQFAEGGAVAAIEAQELRMSLRGSPAPARTTTANSQIATGAASGASAAGNFIAAGLANPLDAFRATRDSARITAHLASASLKWKSLVNHGARYDFKAHTMRRPSTANCPEEECLDTVTLCPGSGMINCYLTDLPGNLFYALLGKYAGFSELTLQLGSQLAQLTGTGAWDPPQDTSAIKVGFSLPLPLTSADLCSILPPAASSLTSRSDCQDCTELTTAVIS
ncbi:MAG: DUF4157 domain-containing protein [Saprospiraceae bacterium]